MNLGINAATPNYNCQRKNSPNFGMAVLVDKNALPVLKNQAMKLSNKAGKNGTTSAYENLWNQINESIDRQKDNPVNIILKKVFGRNAIQAVVVDSTAETAVKNKKFSQGIFSRSGNMKCLEQAEEHANKLNDANARISEFNLATKADYKAGANAAAAE
ncbi:MAG: hypothetical protein NC200_02215 [Candidatus Gastranaerophilales bacterium]|nr:hypothetical protein [Candidatus Gastranaerophilales bacterium]